MQNKYKLDPNARYSAIGAVRNYEKYKEYVVAEEKQITAINSGLSNYELTADRQRAFLPHGNGGSTSVTEIKADKLEALHNSYRYKTVEAVELAFDTVLKKYNSNPELAKKLRKALFDNIKIGRRFCFERSGIIGISRETFYNDRYRILYIIAEKMDFI